MDIMMPNMSGITTLSKLKENAEFKMPVIALTADAIAGAEEKYMQEGFIDYIAKPFTKEQILKKLEIIFNKNTSSYIEKKDIWENAPTVILSKDKVEFRNVNKKDNAPF